jgi:hypothetical protein
LLCRWPLPEPDGEEHDQRSDYGGHHIAQRDRHLIECRKQAEGAEDQASDERAGKPHGEIAHETVSFAVLRRDQAREAAAEQADNDPYDQLAGGGHVRLLTRKRAREEGAVCAAMAIRDSWTTVQCSGTVSWSRAAFPRLACRNIGKAQLFVHPN